MNGTDRWPRPFGQYLANKLAKSRSVCLRNVEKEYRKMVDASSLEAFINIACSTALYIDKQLPRIRKSLGGVTPFSTFRGSFLEEVTLGTAWYACETHGGNLGLEVIKLGTGEGIITGIALAYRTQNLPDPVPVVFRRNREDVIVGFRRSLELSNSDGEKITIKDEAVPICIIACKMYVDATRLENVLSKAENMYQQYSSCTFLVVSEWDALGSDWHDDKRRVLESLFAPIREMIFLRGTDARRPPNAKLRASSLKHPYCPDELRRLFEWVRRAISDWTAD